MDTSTLFVIVHPVNYRTPKPACGKKKTATSRQPRDTPGERAHASSFKPSLRTSRDLVDRSPGNPSFASTAVSIQTLDIIIPSSVFHMHLFTWAESMQGKYGIFQTGGGIILDLLSLGRAHMMSSTVRCGHIDSPFPQLIYTTPAPGGDPPSHLQYYGSDRGEPSEAG